MVYWCPQKVIKKLFRCALKMIEAFFSRLLFFKPLSLIVLYNLISVSKLRIVFSSKCPSRKRQITSAMHFCKNCPQEINKFCKLNSKVKYTKTLNPNKGWIPERNNDTLWESPIRTLIVQRESGLGSPRVYTNVQYLLYWRLN